MPSSLETLIPADAESRTTATHVTDVLRRGILHQKFESGERLRQDAVAVRLGVSQTIVREAFRQLVAEGFLKSEPRRGVSIAVMTADEAAEITQLRSLVEAQALSWAIPRMSEKDCDNAERILTDLDRAKSVDRIISLNAQFHETLYAPSGKERTLALISTLRLNFERYLRFTWEETTHLQESQREHWQLLGLCRKKNTERACTTLQQHILSTGRLLSDRLRLLLPNEGDTE